MIGFWRRPGVAIGVGLVAVFSLLLGRTMYEARTELALGDRYVSEDDPMRAVEHYRRAIRWASPMNPYPARAARALITVALELERQNRTNDALLAWRSILGSEFATRTFFSQAGAHRQDALEHIARLTSGSAGEAPEAGEPAFAHATADDPTTPRSMWAMALLVGFFTWVAGLVVTATRGFDAAGEICWPKARSSLTLALVGFMVFVLGMLFA